MRSIVSCLGAAVCFVLGMSSQAHAGLMHNLSTTPESAYLEFADTFPNVGWLGTVESGATSFGGSAVLINENWVLTAAHAVLSVDSNTNSVYEGYRVGFTDDIFADPGENQFASELFIHPDYLNIGSGPDLALLYFEDPFSSVSPATFYQGSVQVGDPVSFVGYGQPGTPSTGLQPLDGKRRAGTNLVDNIGSPAGYIDAEFNGPGETGFQQLGILGTPGDSGGGWFVENGGQFELLGISSFANVFPGYGANTDATLLTQENIAWVRETIDSRAVPEPASALLFMVGGGLGLLRRSKKS